MKNTEKAACLSVRRIPISELRPHPRNPRKHPPPDSAGWATLRDSLRHDYFDPIVFNTQNNMLVSGHLRTKVLLADGYTHADCVVVEYDEPTHLARMIAANKLIGEDDDEALSRLVAELESAGVDPALSGFGEKEVQKLMRELNPQGETDDTPASPDIAGELQKKWGTQNGQVWVLGNHRIMCGDSTSAEDVATLLAGASPSIMVTDPPYGIEYDPSWRADAGVNKNTGKMGKVENDNIADWSPAWQLFPGDVAYVYHAGVMSATVQSSLEICGFKIRAQIIWAKDRMALSRGDYHWQHEPCWYAVRDGKPGRRNEDRTQTTLWTIPARDDAGHGHGTQKPVECMERPLRNHEFDEVYEPFSGSGTTLIACERLGKRCFAMELNPGYVAMALERWTEITGLTPTKE